MTTSKANKTNSLLTSLLLLLLMALAGCVEMADSFSELPSGVYRGVLFIDKEVRDMKDETFKTIHQIRESELPFNFEIQYDQGRMRGFLLNGEERMEIDSLYFGRAKKGGRDTVRMYFPVYNSYINALFAERYLSGEWVDLNRGDYRIPFKAVHGKDHRFVEGKAPASEDFGGRWAVTFDFDTDDPYRAIGEFEQDANQLSGTFLTETGDFRFLDGNVHESQMFLSTFDGTHAYFFRARKAPDNTLAGVFKSGKHYSSNWKAKRMTDPALDTFLRKPGELTYLKEGNQTLDIDFSLPSGGNITLDDPSLAGRPTIIQILGTWCPNCRDETRFLRDYMLKEKPNISVVGLAFEKRVNQEAMEAILTYKEKMGVEYPIALAGSYRKDEASKALPQLNAVLSYPTMIFLNADHEVLHIHTGFNGPATSSYEEFQREFDYWIKKMTSNE